MATQYDKEAVKIERDKWYKVDMENHRTYTFPTGKITIEKVVGFCVSSTGGHRLKTFNLALSSQSVHFIPAGWLGLEVNADQMTVE